MKKKKLPKELKTGLEAAAVGGGTGLMLGGPAMGAVCAGVSGGFGVLYETLEQKKKKRR